LSNRNRRVNGTCGLQYCDLELARTLHLACEVLMPCPISSPVGCTYFWNLKASWMTMLQALCRLGSIPATPWCDDICRYLLRQLCHGELHKMPVL